MQYEDPIFAACLTAAAAFYANSSLIAEDVHKAVVRRAEALYVVVEERRLLAIATKYDER